jgi:hypothetical protein
MGWVERAVKKSVRMQMEEGVADVEKVAHDLGPLPRRGPISRE